MRATEQSRMVTEPTGSSELKGIVAEINEDLTKAVAVQSHGLRQIESILSQKREPFGSCLWLKVISQRSKKMRQINGLRDEGEVA
jgi:hypothetical protein